MPNKNTRTGMFTFYKDGNERDWQLLGYWNNWILALKYVPLDKLVSFRTPVFNGTNTPPSTVKIRRVKVVNGEVSVISSNDVSLDLKIYTEVINEETLSYYYRQQGSMEAADYLTRGCIYDIYIEDSIGNVFYSDLFVAITETDITLNAEGGQIYLDESGQYILLD